MSPLAKFTFPPASSCFQRLTMAATSTTHLPRTQPAPPLDPPLLEGRSSGKCGGGGGSGSNSPLLHHHNSSSLVRGGRKLFNVSRGPLLRGRPRVEPAAGANKPARPAARSTGRLPTVPLSRSRWSTLPCSMLARSLARRATFERMSQ